MEVAEPLLKPQTSTLNHARPLTCVIFIFIFCLGIFGLTRKQIEEKLGLEEPGSNLPGCKVVSGKYTGQDADGVAKEISLGQKACIGRNIESGEKFRVFGNVIILGTDEKFGEIETNGNIKWTSGEIWVFDQSSIKKCATCGDAKAKAPAKTGPEGCVSVAGSYKELDDNGNVETKVVAYKQTGCIGTVFKSLNAPIPFKIKGNVINMLWGGSNLQGEINPVDQVITWNNGYTHIPNNGDTNFGSMMLKGVSNPGPQASAQNPAPAQNPETPSQANGQASQPPPTS